MRMSSRGFQPLSVSYSFAQAERPRCDEWLQPKQLRFVSPDLAANRQLVPDPTGGQLCGVPLECDAYTCVGVVNLRVAAGNPVSTSNRGRFSAKPAAGGPR